MPIEVNKLAKKKFQENWNLINLLFKQFPENKFKISKIQSPAKIHIKLQEELLNSGERALAMHNYFKESKPQIKPNIEHFQQNQNALIDRMKEILLKSSSEC